MNNKNWNLHVFTCLIAFMVVALCLGCSAKKEETVESQPNAETEISEAKVSSAPEPGRYYNDELGFSIVLPEGWGVKKGKKEYRVVAMSTDEGGGDRFNDRIIITRFEASHDGALDYDIERAKRIMTNIFSDMSVHDEGEINIEGRRARWYICSANFQDKELKAYQFVVSKSYVGFVITCASELDEFDSRKDVFEKTAKSFRFED